MNVQYTKGYNTRVRNNGNEGIGGRKAKGILNPLLKINY